MVVENKNLREKTKARIARDGVDVSIDLYGVLSRFGYEKSLGGEIFRTILNMDAVRGPDYTIKTIQRLTGDPRSYGFQFPAELGKRYAVKYFAKMLEGTGDERYLEGIKLYENNPDSHIRDLVKQTLENLEGGIEPKQEELEMAKIKVNSIVDLIKSSTKNIKGGNK